VEYRIVYANRLIKDLSRLSPEVRSRIRETLKRYAKTPLEHARKMVDPALGTYRFRIGDYRAIFDIEDSDLVILRIGHRRDIYRR